MSKKAHYQGGHTLVRKKSDFFTPPTKALLQKKKKRVSQELYLEGLVGLKAVASASLPNESKKNLDFLKRTKKKSTISSSMKSYLLRVRDNDLLKNKKVRTNSEAVYKGYVEVVNGKLKLTQLGQEVLGK